MGAVNASYTDRFTREEIESAYREHKSLKAAAKVFGIHYQTLHKRMIREGIKRNGRGNPKLGRGNK